MKFKLQNLVEFDRRPAISERIAGFVVASGPEFILLHRLDWNTFMLDGYCAIRSRDARRHRVLNPVGSWQARALKAKRMKPTPLANVSINSLPNLLTSACSAFPLINIQTELRDDELCYIGRLKKLSAETFTFFDLDFRARWTGVRRFKYADITRVEFGSGYENALALSAGRGSESAE